MKLYSLELQILCHLVLGKSCWQGKAQSKSYSEEKAILHSLWVVCRKFSSGKATDFLGEVSNKAGGIRCWQGWAYNRFVFVGRVVFAFEDSSNCRIVECT